MPRCLPAAMALLALASSPLLAHAGLFSDLFEPSQSQAAAERDQVPMQLARSFPPTALKGELVLTQPPAATLNGKEARLAPGARLRGQNNLLLMWNTAVGQKLPVIYTRDSYGLLMDIWVLRPDEVKAHWPKTPEEAAKWVYDPLSKTWSKS